MMIHPMATPTDNENIDWATVTTSALVQLPSHKMLLRAAGPPRQPGHPVVVVECGGGSSSCSWTAVARQVSEFARIYTYDRSGLDRSELTTAPRSAEGIARELQELLSVAKVEGPYILVAHSYGGILAREFLDLERDNVVGAVFVEANTEFSYKVRPEGLFDLIGIFMDDINMNELSNMDERQKLTAEEWAYDNRERTDQEAAAAAKEIEYYFSSADTLADKKQFDRTILKNWPVSVVVGENNKEAQIYFDESVRLGRGTEDERVKMQAFLDDNDAEVRLQTQQLELSTRGRVVKATNSGHNVQTTEPNLIAEEVRWIHKIWAEESADNSPEV